MKNLKSLVLLAILFSYSSVIWANTIIVSDIDDTIKKANSMGGIGGVWYFLRKKPYEETRDLFNEISKDENRKGEKTTFYYVSAAPSYTFNADEWIAKNNFPIGPTYLKTSDNGGNTYDYKYRTIKTLIEKEMKVDPDLKIIFFGDNSQYDAKVYYDLREKMHLENSLIFIRDVSTEATYFAANLPIVKLNDVTYFFSEMELVLDSHFIFMSEKLRNLIRKNYEEMNLIPNYTLETLEERLKLICERGFSILTQAKIKSCKSEAKLEAANYWRDYYSRL
jgi:hypothetical protein